MVQGEVASVLIFVPIKEIGGFEIKVVGFELGIWDVLSQKHDLNVIFVIQGIKFINLYSETPLGLLLFILADQVPQLFSVL